MHHRAGDNEIQGRGALRKRRNRASSDETREYLIYRNVTPRLDPPPTESPSGQPTSDTDPSGVGQEGQASFPSRSPLNQQESRPSLSSSVTASPARLRAPPVGLARPNVLAEAASSMMGAAGLPVGPNPGYRSLSSGPLTSSFLPSFPSSFGVHPLPSLGPSFSESLYLLERQREEREQLLREMAATRVAESLLTSGAGPFLPPSLHARGAERLAQLQSAGTSPASLNLPPESGVPFSASTLSSAGATIPGQSLLPRMQESASSLAFRDPRVATAISPESSVELGLDWRTRRFLGLPPIPIVPPGYVGMHPHPPVDLYMSCDDDVLSDHQILLRKQIEFFEATPRDLHSMGAGRRRDVTVGQVGIRCKHCATLPSHERPRGSIYFPSTLRALYQAAQNMGVSHFNDACKHVDSRVQERLQKYQESKGKAGHAGKKWWANGAKARGVIETDSGLRFDATRPTDV